METCTVETCERNVRTKGFCNAHYLRFNRYGNPLAGKPKPTFEESFWARVAKTDTCWKWTAARFATGYGALRRDNKTVYAHRVAYEMSSGPIPEGMVIDHKCHVRNCVNPDHLRVVTYKQNAENHNGAMRHSKSGIRGVCWDEHQGRWLAQVKHNDRNVFFKHFKSLAEAEAAVVEARNAFHTHNDLDKVAA